MATTRRRRPHISSTLTPTVQSEMKSPVLLIGNFLFSSIGNRSVCEDLALQLVAANRPVFITSERPGRLARLFDMLSTVWRKRREYSLAQIDVFSGLAFIWAEAVCQALRWVGKPYILTLHGGSLPSFAQRWPRRVRHLLRSAATVERFQRR